MKKKIILCVAGLLALIGVIVGIIIAVNANNSNNNPNAKIVASNYPAYTLASAVVGRDNVRMIVPAGTDIHNFEPTASDYEAINNAELFVFNGGESEGWVHDVIGATSSVPTFEMMRVVSLIEESDATSNVDSNTKTEEDSSSNEYDEHVWTSPKNAINIIEKIATRMTQLDPDNSKKYWMNASRTIEEISTLSKEFERVVKDAELDTIIVGDRFPLIYFVDEYDLKYYAAFPGCAEETEPDARTVANLVNKARQLNVPVILKLELSNGKIAEQIASEVGASVKTFNSMQNISAEDFRNGKTYVDFMKDNLEVLKEALRVAN